MASLDEVLPTLTAGEISLWTVDHSAPHDGFNSLLDKLDQVSEEPLPDPLKVNVMSNFLFIFTSGTTGKVLSFHIIGLLCFKININCAYAPFNRDAVWC